MITSNMNSATMTPEQATSRGRIATVFFSGLGLLGWYFAPDKTVSLPMAIMYALLMIQTWFSLPLFFRLIDQKDMRQRIIDPVIGVAYALLAYTIGNPILFTFAWAIFFTLTVLKYSMLVGTFSNTTLLRRKLMANILGVALGLAMPTFLGFGLIGEWIGVILFAGACVQYLVLRPLYVTDKV